MNQPDKPSTPPPSPYYLAALEVAQMVAERAKRQESAQKGGEK